MLTIYSYLEPSLYLRDIWDEKKRKNNKFTIRAWAKQLNMKYHNSLHEIITGKRKLPKSYIPLLIDNLKLPIHEGLYLNTMVDLQKARTIKEKEIYVERLRSLSPKAKLNMHEVETFRSLKNPLHIIITELSCLKGFKNDPAWIKQKLGFRCSQIEIHQAIQRLISLKLMFLSEKGELKKVHEHNYSKSDVTDSGLQEYHKNVMDLAARAISKQEVSEREYNAYCINMMSSNLPQAKLALRKFMNDFAQEFEAKVGTADDTYQLNLQFFNLTKQID